MISNLVSIDFQHRYCFQFNVCYALVTFDFVLLSITFTKGKSKTCDLSCVLPFSIYEPFKVCKHWEIHTYILNLKYRNICNQWDLNK